MFPESLHKQHLASLKPVMRTDEALNVLAAPLEALCSALNECTASGDRVHARVSSDLAAEPLTFNLHADLCAEIARACEMSITTWAPEKEHTRVASFH